jgi:hypothetical protein
MMMAFLVELGPRRPKDISAEVLAAKVARSFGPRPQGRLASDPSLKELSRRRLGLVRDTDLGAEAGGGAAPTGEAPSSQG